MLLLNSQGAEYSDIRGSWHLRRPGQVCRCAHPFPGRPKLPVGYLGAMGNLVDALRKRHVPTLGIQSPRRAVGSGSQQNRWVAMACAPAAHLGSPLTRSEAILMPSARDRGRTCSRDQQAPRMERGCLDCSLHVRQRCAESSASPGSYPTPSAFASLDIEKRFSSVNLRRRD